jgi:hypothetical protein
VANLATERTGGNGGRGGEEGVRGKRYNEGTNKNGSKKGSKVGKFTATDGNCGDRAVPVNKQ